MKNALFSALLALAVCGCASTEKQLIGTWVEPIPSIPGQMQGVSLQQGGVASSVNMATLQYERWNTANGQLVLEGKSIGNGQTIPFTETLKIEKLDEGELILSSDGNTRQYTRQK